MGLNLHDAVLSVIMWVCWLQLSCRAPCAVRVCTTVSQRHPEEVCDFEDTETIDGNRVVRKIQIFKMGSSRAMRLIYQTINLLFRRQMVSKSVITKWQQLCRMSFPSRNTVVTEKTLWQDSTFFKSFIWYPLVNKSILERKWNSRWLSENFSTVSLLLSIPFFFPHQFTRKKNEQKKATRIERDGRFTRYAYASLFKPIASLC